MNKNNTIGEAKMYLRENFNKGTDCPCCGRHVKLYPRKLNSGMAVTMIRIYRSKGKEFVHVKDFLREHKYHNGGDWTLLRFWNLIEERPQKFVDQDQKSSGVWRITDLGEKFIKEQIEVYSHILTFNDRCYGFKDQKTTTITKALGNKFNYFELMNS